MCKVCISHISYASYNLWIFQIDLKFMCYVGTYWWPLDTRLYLIYELWTEIWGSLRSFLYKTVLVKPVNIGIRCLSLQLYNNLCIILSGSCQAVSSPYWDLNDLLNLKELFLYKIILFYIFVSELELGPVSRIVYFDSFGKYFKKFLYFTKNDLQWSRQSKPQRINEIVQYWTKTNSI